MIVVYYRDYLPPWEEEKDRVLLVSCGYNAINPREQNYRSRVTASLLFHSGMIMFVDMLPKPADALFYSRQLITTLGTQISVSKRDRLPANSALVVVSNHRSFMDAAILMAALDLPIHFACHHYMGQIPLVGELVNQLGFLPLDEPKQRFHTFLDEYRSVPRSPFLPTKNRIIMEDRL